MPPVEGFGAGMRSQIRGRDLSTMGGVANIARIRQTAEQLGLEVKTQEVPSGTQPWAPGEVVPWGQATEGGVPRVSRSIKPPVRYQDVQLPSSRPNQPPFFESPRKSGHHHDSPRKPAPHHRSHSGDPQRSNPAAAAILLLGTRLGGTGAWDAEAFGDDTGVSGLTPGLTGLDMRGGTRRARSPAVSGFERLLGAGLDLSHIPSQDVGTDEFLDKIRNSGSSQLASLAPPPPSQPPFAFSQPQPSEWQSEPFMPLPLDAISAPLTGSPGRQSRGGAGGSTSSRRDTLDHHPPVTSGRIPLAPSVPIPSSLSQDWLQELSKTAEEKRKSMSRPGDTQPSNAPSSFPLPELKPLFSGQGPTISGDNQQVSLSQPLMPESSQQPSTIMGMS